MTLSEIATLVTTKMHRTDAQSVTEAKVYIRARYKMLWESRPWRDSISMITIPSASVTRITILPKIVDRVLAVRWGTLTNLLPADLGTVFSMDPNLFERTGDPAAFSLITPSGVDVSPAGEKIKVSSSDASATFKVSVRGIYGNDEKNEVITTAGTTEILSVNNYDEIFSLSKNSSTLDMTAKKSSGATILTLGTTETSLQFQRLHFHTTPTTSQNLLVLFKRRFRPLNEDSDSTELTGIDNALLAAAESDMHEAQRQFTKASAKMQEAGAMATAMSDLERHQSASSATLVPWDAAMSSEGYDYTYEIP